MLLLAIPLLFGASACTLAVYLRYRKDYFECPKSDKDGRRKAFFPMLLFGIMLAIFATAFLIAMGLILTAPIRM